MNASRHHIAEVIGKRTLHITDSKKLANEIAAFLLEENRTTELDSLLRDIEQYRAEHGIAEATAVTARQLSDKVKADVKDLLKQHYSHIKTVILDEEIDSQVVGGIRIDMAQEQLDATIQSKLNTFKRLVARENG